VLLLDSFSAMRGVILYKNNLSADPNGSITLIQYSIEQKKTEQFLFVSYTTDVEKIIILLSLCLLKKFLSFNTRKREKTKRKEQKG